MSTVPEKKTMPARSRSRILEPEVRREVDTALRQMRLLAGFRHVRFVLLHGSTAEGRTTAESDIDLSRLL